VGQAVALIQAEADGAGRVDWNVSVDSSIVRAHQHSRCRKTRIRAVVFIALVGDSLVEAGRARSGMPHGPERSHRPGPCA
jgi:hypothetical protein